MGVVFLQHQFIYIIPLVSVQSLIPLIFLLKLLFIWIGDRHRSVIAFNMINMYIAQNVDKTKYVISSLALVRFDLDPDNLITNISSLCKFIKDTGVMGFQYDPRVSRSGVYAIDLDRSLLVMVTDNTIMVLVCMICECPIEEHTLEPDRLLNPELFMCHLNMTQHTHDRTTTCNYTTCKYTGPCQYCRDINDSTASCVWYRTDDVFKRTSLSPGRPIRRSSPNRRSTPVLEVVQTIQEHGVLAAFHACVSDYIIYILNADPVAVLYCVPDPESTNYHWGVVCMLCRNNMGQYISRSCARDEDHDMLRNYLTRIATMCQHTPSSCKK